MVCKTKSATIVGVDAQMVNVEVDISDGLPSFDMVGLLSSEIKESRERIRTAIRNSGVKLPAKRITVNLSPADIKKTGSYFDLPIAVSILCAMGLVSAEKMKNTLFIGELGLDGSVLGVSGVLPIILKSIECNTKYFYVPQDNLTEACMAGEINVCGISCLAELIYILNNETDEMFVSNSVMPETENENTHDFKYVVGQQNARRAAEIAVAGMHNILLMGVPGSGKSMIAKCIPGIMPTMSYEECMDVWKIYSAAGKLKDEKLTTQRPFRSPHHTVTAKSLVGGGTNPKPGEVTLAHRGVLFLDEFPEFSRNAIEALRQPLEDGYTLISRTNGTYYFPAKFMLVAAMNNCKCGYYPDLERCKCTPYEIDKYLSKISGPILDRIDICASTIYEKYDSLQKTTKQESSDEIRQRVERALRVQRKRYEGTSLKYNSELDGKSIKKYCKLGKKENELMEQIFNNLKLSFRSYFKILKVARTISDLDGDEKIECKHLYEAASYRPPQFIRH